MNNPVSYAFNFFREDAVFLRDFLKKGWFSLPRSEQRRLLVAFCIVFFLGFAVLLIVAGFLVSLIPFSVVVPFFQWFGDEENLFAIIGGFFAFSFGLSFFISGLRD